MDLSNRPCDLLGDFTLDGEQVVGGQFTVEDLRPKVLIGLCIDQLHIDAHGIARALHRAFHDRRDAEFRGDLRDGLGGVLVLADRGA